MLCLSGLLRDGNVQNFVLQCRRRADGSVLWQDVRPLQPGEFTSTFLDVNALDDGGAVAIRGVLGSVQHWLIGDDGQVLRSEEHTSELQSLMRISYAVFCLKKKTANNTISKLQY